MKGDISEIEIRDFWRSYWRIMFYWNLHSFFALISTAVIWDFISKNYLGSKVYYTSMNDTEDGDFGADWWLKKKGYKKKSVWTAFNWWFRNHSWNYIRKYNPPWKAGETEDFIVVKDTLNKKDTYGRFTRADKTKGIYGVHHIAYRIEGEVFCQWSYANKFFHIQLGTGGSEYRFRTKLF